MLKEHAPTDAHDMVSDPSVWVDGVALAGEIREALEVIVEEADEPLVAARVTVGLDAACRRLSAIEGEARPTAVLIANVLGRTVVATPPASPAGDQARSERATR
jgi:hypothetical protein